MNKKVLHFEYVNYKGEKDVRDIIPLRIEFGCSPQMSEPDWLLWGVDLKKKAERAFVIKHIVKFIE